MALESLMQLNEQFKRTVNQLETSEGQLLQMWEGTAKTVFHNAFLSDREQMELFYNTVIQFQQQLREALQRYAQAEAANVDMASSRTYH